MGRLLTLTAIVLAPVWASADDSPRVASINVCTDQLVMLLAEPDQIVSLSLLADDPRSSVMASKAGLFAKNTGRAEALAVQKPDVVVAGEYNDPALIALLRSIGIEVVQFPVTRALADIPGEIRKMGDVLGQAAKADRIASDLELTLEKPRPLTDDAPLAAFFFPNGFALGAGTLSHDILVAGGARNLSVELGFQGNGTLSLEQVILHAPDLLIGAQTYDGFSLSEEMVTHPALSQVPVLHTNVDWVCGTPYVMRAIADVSASIDALLVSNGD